MTPDDERWVTVEIGGKTYEIRPLTMGEWQSGEVEGDLIRRGEP